MASWIWVFIPIVAILAGVAKRWISMKEREIDHLQRDAADKQARYAAMTERLEQRVRVLERIATDKGIDVSEEIERLRDAR
ncbi:MAG TPA: hypothetical protein VF552_02565 [Allosphingosinicella sp.]|jgi:hypothetical protein